MLGETDPGRQGNAEAVSTKLETLRMKGEPCGNRFGPARSITLVDSPKRVKVRGIVAEFLR